MRSIWLPGVAFVGTLAILLGAASTALAQAAFTGLGDLPGGSFYSVAQGVSADGSVVVGRSLSGSGFEAFRWTPGDGMVGLGALPGDFFNVGANGVSADGSVVVGFSSFGPGFEAFCWTSGGGMVALGDLPEGLVSSGANGVSADGSVVVGLGTTDVGAEAFRWTLGGEMVGLGDLPGGAFFSEAFGVSADGSVVVGHSGTGSGNQAFIWDAANDMRNLQEVLTDDFGLGSSLAGWTLTRATGVSVDGLAIVGYGISPDGYAEAWIAYLGAPNQSPLADAGPDVVMECQGALTPVSLDGSLSSDPDGDPLQYEWSVAEGSGATIADPTAAITSGTFPVGPTLVTLTVTDGAGGVDVADVLITVVDTVPPVVVCTTDRAALWPPNHEMVVVELSVLASDCCDDPAGLLVNCFITSNEPDDATGDGSSIGDTDGADGFTAPIAVELTYSSQNQSYDATINLRAERDGANTSRVYSIVCDVLDTAGNLATSSCVVLVPHDRRKK